MSITFSTTGAPYSRVPCEWCALASARGEAGTPWVEDVMECAPGGHVWRCSPGCPGDVLQSEAPEVNMANDNAADLLALLSIDADSGQAGAALLRQRIMVARHSDRSSALRAPASGARFYAMGTSDADVLRRLALLETLAIYAQAARCANSAPPAIVWA